MIAALVFLGSFFLYLMTLNGTIPAYRDSGDLVNAIATLGIAHPPGYPLYVVLGKLFTTLVPFANAAYRVNLFSAACAAGTAVLLYLAMTTGKNDLLGKLVGCMAALVFSITPACFNLARVAEMYSLTAMFGTGVILCYLKDTPQSLWLGSFLLGCGFGVHPTLLFLIPLLVPMKRSKWNLIPGEAGFFLLGFSVVLILWTRSSVGPIQNWGNPSTFKGLWQVITRSNYGGLKLHPVESQFSWTGKSVIAQSFNFLRTLTLQWGWLGVVAGFAGWGSTFRKSSRLALCWLLSGALFFILSNLPLEEKTTASILEPYMILVNLIWALWIAQGAFELLKRVKFAGAQVLLLLVFLVVPVTELRGSFQSFRDHFYAYDLGRNILRTLPSGAVMYDPDDPISFTLRANQLLEHRRQDVVLLNFFRTYWGYQQIKQRWPDLLPPGVPRSAQELEQEFWDYSIRRYPFYADLPMKVPSPMAYRVEGLVYPLTAAPAPPTSRELQRADQVFSFYVWRGTWQTTAHPDFFTRQILNYRAAAYCNLGLKYAERHDRDIARRWYRQALSVDPHLAAAYNDMGVIDYEEHAYDSALHNFQQAVNYEPANPGFLQNLTLAQQGKFLLHSR